MIMRFLIIILPLFLIGCATPELNEQTVSDSAKSTTIGIIATMSIDVAKRLQKYPEEKEYFMKCADSFKVLANTKTNYISAKPLWNVVNGIPAPSKKSKTIVSDGVRFYKGGINSHLDAEYVLNTLAQSIKIGITESLPDIKKNLKRVKLEYAIIRSGGHYR